jgi:hypothetical protein
MPRTPSHFPFAGARRFALLATLALVLPACNDNLIDPQERVDEVIVSPEITFLQVGESRTLQAAPHAADGRLLSGRQISWRSSDASVATVDGAGRVVAIRDGSVWISAIADGRSGKARVDVFTPFVPVDSVHVQQDSVVLQRGGVRQLQATVRAADGHILTDRHLTWSSSHPGKVQVDASGRILAYHVGTERITVTSEGKTSRIKVIVQPAPEFHLRSAAGNPLPAEVYTGNYTLPDGTVRQVRGTVTDGFLWLTDDGRFLMTVMRVTYENGVATGSNAYYNQGEYTRSATGELSFRPDGVAPALFTGRVTESGVSLTHSVYMDGPPVTFLYERQ